MRLAVLAFVLFAAFAPPAAAEFVDQFDALSLDQDAQTGWAYRTGDGEAVMSLTQGEGAAILAVDARADRRNIWWAMIRRSISHAIDRRALARADRELRVEARVRASAAPRRINLHVNHSRTTDFHSHLKEYDLPVAGEWRIVSMTTRRFDARADDDVFVQLALMDWGRERYELEIDYIKVRVVDPRRAGPDFGGPLPYRPPIPPLTTFAYTLAPAADASIDAANPFANLAAWRDGAGAGPLDVVSGSHTMLLRWDFSAFAGRAPIGWGVLALATHSLQRAETGLEEFGELRVVEILGGDEHWTRAAVTHDSFMAGAAPDDVLNGQMMIDVPPAQAPGDITLISVSPPVLKRLLSGQTKGLAIVAQGSLVAAFWSGEAPDARLRPLLYFNAAR